MVFINLDIMILCNIMSDVEIDKVIKILKFLVRWMFFYLIFNFFLELFGGICWMIDKSVVGK